MSLYVSGTHTSTSRNAESYSGTSCGIMSLVVAFTSDSAFGVKICSKLPTLYTNSTSFSCLSIPTATCAAFPVFAAKAAFISQAFSSLSASHTAFNSLFNLTPSISPISGTQSGANMCSSFTARVNATYVPFTLST